MRSAVAVVALALTALASGCSGESEGAPPLPPITATPSVTANASATVATYPDTPQGAASFARFVLEQIDRAYQEKDPELIRGLFDPSCKSCSNYLGSVERIKKEDLEVSGGDTTVLSSETPGGQSGAIEVSMRTSFGGATITDKAGVVVLKQPATDESQLTMTVRRLGSSYSVMRIVNV